MVCYTRNEAHVLTQRTSSCEIISPQYSSMNSCFAQSSNANEPHP